VDTIGTLTVRLVRHW